MARLKFIMLFLPVIFLFEGTASANGYPFGIYYNPGGPHGDSSYSENLYGAREYRGYGHRRYRRGCEKKYRYKKSCKTCPVKKVYRKCRKKCRYKKKPRTYYRPVARTLPCRQRYSRRRSCGQYKKVNAYENYANKCSSYIREKQSRFSVGGGLWANLGLDSYNRSGYGYRRSGGRFSIGAGFNLDFGWLFENRSYCRKNYRAYQRYAREERRRHEYNTPMRQPHRLEGEAQS